MLPCTRAIFTWAALGLASCQSAPNQPYPWPGTVSIGVIPTGPFEVATTISAFSMPDPDSWGPWWQFSFDPTELIYTSYSGTPDEEEYEEDPGLADFSFSRDGATLGFGFGMARNLGDRLMIFAGTGWAMAFEHEYERSRKGAYDYREDEHIHYLTSGLNLMGGIHYRITPNFGIEAGYQSFYESWYIGIAAPF